MPEKKYLPGGQARPVEFTEEEATALKSGHTPAAMQVGERLSPQARPKALEQSDVEALVAGQEISLEGRREAPPATGDPQGAADRPADLTQKDVDALTSSKEVDLAQKDRLPPQ